MSHAVSLASPYRRFPPSSCYFLSSSHVPLLGAGAFALAGVGGRGAPLVGRRIGAGTFDAEVLGCGSALKTNGCAVFGAAFCSGIGISRAGAAVTAAGVPADVGPASSCVLGRNRSSLAPAMTPAPATKIAVAIKSRPRRVDRFVLRAVCPQLAFVSMTGAPGGTSDPPERAACWDGTVSAVAP